VREVERETMEVRPSPRLAERRASDSVNDARTATSGTMTRPPTRTTTGWSPSCDHDRAPIPATILDCFGGSGTTALVARKLGRRSILIELSEEYCAMAARRLQQLSLLAKAQG